MGGGPEFFLTLFNVTRAVCEVLTDVTPCVAVSEHHHSTALYSHHHQAAMLQGAMGGPTGEARAPSTSSYTAIGASSYPPQVSETQRTVRAEFRKRHALLEASKEVRPRVKVT